MQQDHSPVRLNEFNGLFGIDEYNDSVPKDHFIDSLNTITEGGQIRTRDGVAEEITFAAIKQIYYWRIQNEATRVIVLNDIGQLFDLTVSAVTPILVISLMSHFAASPFNNRLYISPHNGISGLPGEFVYVYTGTGLARKAAGLAPVGGFTIVEGTKKANFSIIPVGPSGTAKRKLIASKAIQTYDGNQNAYEMFFVPGGTINNNATTELNDIDFYDADLQLSADYSFDQLAEIPAVLFLSSYGRRMIYGSTDLDKNIVYISKDNEPESINSLAGFQSFDPHETEGVKDATEFRGNLYVCKRHKTYAGRDNTYEPSTWKFDTIDSSIGCDTGGIAKYIDTKGSKSDFFIVADSAGFFKYTGVYEELPLSYKIKNWWKRINQAYAYKMQVLIDVEKLLIYILLPLDGAVSPNYIMIGEYEYGLNFDKIKWHLWSFQDFSPSSIAIDIDYQTKRAELKISSLSGNIYSPEVNRRNDDGTAILSHIKFALLGDVPNAIHHVGAVGLRVKGSGILGLELRGEDNVDVETVPALTLVAIPGKEYIRPCKFQSEKASLKISMASASGYFILKETVIYQNIVFLSRPA